jgi:hypothetical protein
MPLSAVASLLIDHSSRTCGRPGTPPVTRLAPKRPLCQRVIHECRKYGGTDIYIEALIDTDRGLVK